MTLAPRKFDRADDAASLIDGLSRLLIACTDGGASVGFMAPLDIDGARAFWAPVLESAQAGSRALFLIKTAGEIVGTAQMIPAPMPNQPHRADIAKVLVAPTARRQGIGSLLMRACEEEALKHGRWLLTLDTVAGSAGEALYLSQGWQRTGTIPDYALMPDGALCATMIMWKRLRSPA